MHGGNRDVIRERAVAQSFDATVRVRGEAADREAFRRRANERLAIEFPDVAYRELHDSDALDWRLRCIDGMPFPPFVEASIELPLLEVQLEWQAPGSGTAVRRATLRAGNLALEEAGPDTSAGALAPETVAARAAADGELVYALAMRRTEAGEWAGYVASATRHAFFRWSAAAGRLHLSEGLDPEWHWSVSQGEGGPVRDAVSPPEAMPDALAELLHDLADRFAAEWLWFDAAPEAETAIERHRFAQYGFPVWPANLRTRKLKVVLKPDATGFSLVPDDADARAAAMAVVERWAVSATT